MLISFDLFHDILYAKMMGIAMIEKTEIDLMSHFDNSMV